METGVPRPQMPVAVSGLMRVPGHAADRLVTHVVAGLLDPTVTQPPATASVVEDIDGREVLVARHGKAVPRVYVYAHGDAIFYFVTNVRRTAEAAGAKLP